MTAQTTVNLIAPTGYSGTVICSSGNNYTIDNYGQIAAKFVDVGPLLSAGYVFADDAGAARNKFDATAAPGATNDSTQDFAVGSRWVDITHGTVYACVDATASAAVWVQLGGPSFSAGLALMSGRTPTGLVLDATGGSGLFKIVSSVGTSLLLQGENANNNTKTDDVIFEYVLPASYVAGHNITATVNLALTGGGTPGTKTAQVKAYKISTAGAAGADIGPGTTSAITAAGADITAVITGTTLSPGDKLLIEVETVLQETASTNLAAQVRSIRLA